jgi:hypothetical protein
VGERDANHEVATASEPEAECPAVVRGKEAADRRALRPKRIDREPLAVPSQCLLERPNPNAALNGHREIGVGVLEDVAEACG